MDYGSGDRCGWWDVLGARLILRNSDDLGDAVVFALEKWDPNSQNAPKDKNNNPLTILNVGSGKDIAIRELAYKISNF